MSATPNVTHPFGTLLAPNQPLFVCARTLNYCSPTIDSEVALSPPPPFATILSVHPLTAIAKGGGGGCGSFAAG